METQHKYTISHKCKLYFDQKDSFQESHPENNFTYLIQPNPSNICKYMPKDFNITTRNGSCKFNKLFLKETSVTISNYLEDNHDELTYHLDIDDPKNILGKFEQLYSGQKVYFQKEDIQTCHKITTLLFIIYCPNFMKPKALSCDVEGHDEEDEYDEEDVNYTFFPVQMKGIINFLKDKKFNTFKISTKRMTYKCNIFSVYLSDVIRAQLEEDPENDHFYYDFEDDCNEFQVICDFFNLQSIQISRNIFDSVIEIVKDLKIEYILNDINYIIENSDKIDQKLDDNQTIVDSIDELFDWLYNIKDKTVKTVKNLILESAWIDTEENVQELVAFLLEVISTDNLLHPYIYDLIIELNGQSNESNHLKVLQPFIVQKMINCLINDINAPELISKNPIPKYKSEIDVINTNTNQFIYAFIYKFYRKGIIPKNTLFDILRNYDFKNKYINLWFLPLFAEMDDKNINSIIISKAIGHNDYDGEYEEYIDDDEHHDINDFIRPYLPDKMDLYEKMLDKGEPDDSLIKALRSDDVDTVQKITTELINKKEITIPFNIFDYFLFENLTILNYAAAYGSLKCFKYLLLNNNDINDETLELAIYGGNIEIIKIVYQKNEFHNNEKQNDIIFAIRKHKNDLFDWLLENIHNKSSFMYNIAQESARHGNAHCLTEIIDKGFIITNKNYNEMIHEASENGFYRFLVFLKAISPFSPTFIIIINKSKNSYIRKKPSPKKPPCKPVKKMNDLCTIHFGNLSIFKLFINNIDQSNIIEYICFAAKNNYKSIINYYFEQIFEHKKKVPNSINQILEASLQRNDANSFDNILQKVYSLNFSNKIGYNYLLQKGVEYTNFEAIKEITNIILKDNPNFDFSDGFNKSALLGLNEICQYFIDKKVKIKHDSLVNDCEKYGLLNKNIYSIILNQINPNLKTRFLSNIKHAIKSKNHELVDYLFQENARCEDALCLAVDQNDINLVNIVLKYQNDPELINKVGENGAALINAAQNNNLQIVKKLFSIPGINPSIYDYNDKIIRFPLTVALKNKNIDIINAILDFYGENIQYQRFQLDEAMKIILTIYMETRNNDSFLTTIHRFLDIKYINPNILYTDDKIKKNIIIYNINNSDDDEEEEEVCKRKKKIEKKIKVSDIIKNHLEEVKEEDSKNSESANYIIKDNKSFISKIEKFLDMEYLEEKDINEKEKEEEEEKDELLNITNFKNIYYYKQIKAKQHNYINKIGSVDTFLLCACARNDINIVKKLVNLDQLDINQYSLSNGDTALIIAIKKKNTQIAKLLINNPKTNINQRTFYNETALSIAAYNELFKIAIILLKDERLCPDENLIKYVYYISNYDVRKVILSSKYIKFFVDDLSYILHKAVKNIEIDLIDAIIQSQFFDNNKIDIDDIALAIKLKSFNVFQKLIKLKNNNVNLKDSNNTSLLAHAARVSDELIIVNILNNEKFDAKESNIVEAFVQSYSNSRIRKLCQLQKAINKYQIKNKDIILNLIESRKQYIINSMTRLYEYDQKHDQLIDFTKLLPNGESYFTSITFYYRGLEQVFDFFIQNGIDPNMPDSNNLYPLEMAIVNNWLDLVKFFINTNKIDYSVKIPIKYEYEEEEIEEEEYNEEECKEEECKKEDNLKNVEFTTYLHIAIQSGNYQIIKEFLDKNLIDINITDSNGDTPLIEACRYEDFECIKALFENDNLDFNHCNNDGYDAIAVLSKIKTKEPIKDKDEYLKTIEQYLFD